MIWMCTYWVLMGLWPWDVLKCDKNDFCLGMKRKKKGEKDFLHNF